MDLEGTRAVVTGGASGIGRALAEELLTRGATVMIADIDGARARAVAAELGRAVLSGQCDVADHQSAELLAEVAERDLGPIDMVFANAGVSLSGPLLQAKPEEFDWVFGVNVRGVWSTVAAFARRMTAAGRTGRFCITASEHALGLQHTGAGFYTASKHAVLGLAEVLRAELPPTLKMSVLCPGLVATEIHLSRRHSGLPQPDPAQLAVGEAVVRRGMPASAVAVAAVNGVIRGDFLIVTHPVSFPAAEARGQEVAAAFAAQAPWVEGAERYDVKRVLAAVLAEARQGGSR
ncbi:MULTISPECIES: SDR family oxidoreductase [unclassified Bradyrhizobium]|uniref:SDR family oxidoreductase n=1 Tax=unclassified Bradyrhizobium TaxID=2631580 RepID=UPI0015CE7F7F|nr:MULTISPECIES: SDR family oxidoreductase [unclassified Bradyrhizobium]MBB4260532.1 NAD(P)-dependent dehydrogenase (short-subunit alcohol dehydrogenase family) [Bradyrhizobium sp. CIR3A]NYG46802.1 NAD(P)-dependent dehydrogenase (short-subunit alcohol dehydrogenase family) [Bradyrhizobium sp. IAR9]